MKVRNKQCAACPWKVTTDPDKDIPGGYCKKQHAALKRTIAEEGVILAGSNRMMACHESETGNEYPCVGWVAQQLGPGNNIGLRMLARDGRFNDMELDGEQHQTLEETL